jgi:hypothetical protein
MKLAAISLSAVAIFADVALSQENPATPGPAQPSSSAWPAPVGHRQPRMSDLPADVAQREYSREEHSWKDFSREEQSAGRSANPTLG